MTTENYAEKFEAAKTISELLLFRDELRSFANNTKWDGDPDSPELSAIQNANYYITIVQEKVSELIGEKRPIDTPVLVTKREYFAAMAMQGILANSAVYMSADPKETARQSTDLADALLQQLNPSPQ